MLQVRWLSIVGSLGDPLAGKVAVSYNVLPDAPLAGKVAVSYNVLPDAPTGRWSRH